MATQTAPVGAADHQKNGEIPPEQKALVQAALSEVLESTPFKTSKQSQQLLQYIVLQTVRGHYDLLKERIIGAEVFGRHADYDTSDDPIVRTRAGDVRKRLAQYYLGEGRQSTLRIEISPGSYHATLVEPPKPAPVVSVTQVRDADAINEVSAGNEVNLSQVRDPSRSVNQNRRTAKIWLTGVIALFATGAAAWLLLWPRKPIDVFWQPLLDAKKPVLIYSGANAVYMLKAQFIDKYESIHHIDTLENKGHEFVVPLSPDTKISASDLISFNNEFVTLGDLSANVRVAALLTAHNKDFDLRSGEDVGFSDLHESPSLLVGAFNNRWTMELTGDLPFVFDRELTIRDRIDKSRSWTPTFSPEGAVTQDYAVVTRIPHSKSDQPLITIAGITQFGTRAAADFITSPQFLSDFLESAPKDWASKKMQVVLQSKVVNNIPTTPIVVAKRYW
jgi:hypothetical protein